MRAPYSSRNAQTVLGGLFVNIDTVEDVFPEAATEDEGDEDSESDSEGDLMPGANNCTTSGASTPEPQHEQSLGELKLNMVHSTLLLPKPDGTIKYDVANGINTFISPASSLYRSGGPVVRVQESRSWNMDVMLCCKQLCEFCTKLGEAESSLDDCSEAADWEERRVFDSAISPYRGTPFVHSKDIRIRKDLGGLVFSPLGVADANAVLSRTDETREVDVLFTVSKKKVRLKCLACAVGQCMICTEARAEAGRQSSLVQEEQPSSSKPKQHQRRQQSIGRKVGRDALRQEFGDGAQDDAEMVEQLFIDGDGDVSREFVPRGSPSGSSIEVAPRRSKAKRNVVDE